MGESIRPIPQKATIPQLRQHINLLVEAGFDAVEIRYDDRRCPYILGMKAEGFDDLADRIDAA